ncbi:UNVERIFIED_CONTAM: hypothetical protein RMT77_007983 [Armadillidium vulgare]
MAHELPRVCKKLLWLKIPIAIFVILIFNLKTERKLDLKKQNNIGKTFELDLRRDPHDHPYECKNHKATRDLKFPKEVYDQNFIKRHPNLPRFLVNATKLSTAIPDLSRIRWSGIVYQESWKFSPKFLLYSANFDSRTKYGLLVRIISLYDGESKTYEGKDLYCQFWFDENGPIAVPVIKVTFIHNIRFSKEHLNSFGITCLVPTINSPNHLPSAVSLVNKACETPTNLLKIHGSPERKLSLKNKNLKIGVCGKALYYYNEDFSSRLIEWIEILKLFGIDQIFLYKTTCHENVTKVLQHYEKDGFVRLTTFYYPPPYGQDGTFTRFWAKSWVEAYRAVQTIYLNDCIHRNKDSFDYLGVFDSDEVLIMNHKKSVQELLKSLNSMKVGKKPGTYLFQWKNFYQNLKPGPSAVNIPEEFYNLRHNKRTKLDAKEAPVLESNGKSFHDTRQILWISCHEPLKYLYNSQKDITPNLQRVKRKYAYMGHFSIHTCRKETLCSEEDTEEELFLIKYKDIIMKNVKKVKSKLKL